MSTTPLEIINKVKQSKLITIDFEKWIRIEQIVNVDLKEFLFNGLIVKEKEFREAIEGLDTSRVEGKICRLYCSIDTIIPKWAWMLVTLKLFETAEFVHVTSESDLIRVELLRKIHTHDWAQYTDGFVILKGCSRLDIPEAVYAEATIYCSLYAKKVMYGEACSNVPIYKRS